MNRTPTACSLQPPACTVVMTNWKRPQSFRKVLDAVASQTVQPEIFVWNNGPAPVEDARITWCVHSTRNCLCWPRWFMAAHAETPFVANIDDDLLPSDDRVLQDAIATLDRLPESAIVGAFGRQLLDGRPFADNPHVQSSQQDKRVDVIKGRLMVMRTGRLRQVLLARPPGPTAVYSRCDDVVISSLMAGGRRQCHVVPAVLSGRFQDLPQPHAIHQQPGFGRLRAQAAALFFDWKP